MWGPGRGGTRAGPGSERTRAGQVSHGPSRARHGSIGFWYRLAVVLLRPLLTVLTRRDWRGGENIPVDGGFVAVVNHVSHVDPLTAAVAAANASALV